MAFTDSCWAFSINEHVFTTMTSASSARGTSSAPAWVSMPIMTSLSTRFLGQPRLTNPTFGAAGFVSELRTDTDFGDMRSHYSNIRRMERPLVLRVGGERQRREEHLIAKLL